ELQMAVARGRQPAGWRIVTELVDGSTDGEERCRPVDDGRWPAVMIFPCRQRTLDVADHRAELAGPDRAGDRFVLRAAELEEVDVVGHLRYPRGQQAPLRAATMSLPALAGEVCPLGCPLRVTQVRRRAARHEAQPEAGRQDQ